MNRIENNIGLKNKATRSERNWRMIDMPIEKAEKSNYILSTIDHFPELKTN